MPEGREGSTESGVDLRIAPATVCQAVFEGDPPLGPPASRACAGTQPDRSGPCDVVRATPGTSGAGTRPKAGQGSTLEVVPAMRSEIQSSRRVPPLLAE